MNQPSPTHNIPPHVWQRPIGLDWERPYTVRYASNLDDGPWHGVPLGGFGAGCIGRSPRGDFNLWHLDSGEHIFQNLPACQFSIFEEANGLRQTYALSTEPPTDGTLSSWKWYPKSTDRSVPHSTGTYSALYPRSWFVYENVFRSQLSCEQLSPIWAGNYQESSYPLAIFEWIAHNPTDAPVTLNIMLTWENIMGWFTNSVKTPKVEVRDDGSPVYEYKPRWGESGGNFNRLVNDYHRTGIVMSQLRLGDEVNQGEGQMAIATFSNAAVEVSYNTRWNPAGNGDNIWEYFSRSGFLLDQQDETPASDGERIASALSVRFTLRPGKTRKIPFFVAWDLPVVEFGEGVWYYRRYTDFYGRNAQNVWSMVRTAMKHYDTWRENIKTWQEPILQREDLPGWFKMALFNELYDLTSGGTLWSAGDERDPKGQFAVLECLDYRWYESLDVRLYGSFALLMLWPELEKSVLLAFARAISAADETPRVIGYDRSSAARKIAGATPHDLGAPNEHPWEMTNYTSYQDCNLWKDLPSDFVLQVYRDFLLTGADDFEFLWDCWPAVVETLDYLKGFDLDGDGIPENSGAPDQTFDDWKMRGVSAYCGGLWLAALSAARAIGKVLMENPRQKPFYPAEDARLDDDVTSTTEAIGDRIAIYEGWLESGLPVYQEKLWNGEYYNLDSESGSRVVMADQLCGQFYSRLLDLPDIVPPQRALSALKTVYNACFKNFYDGKFGAANGLLPDGSPANVKDTHPLEVWIGINFGLAAFMVQVGMKEEGFELAGAAVAQIYENGLQFRTPEAITATGTFRASHYLRAMAIWAIYLSINGNK